MKTATNKIKRTVMRRVYTAYAASIVSSQVMLYGALFLVALAVFAQAVHIAKVFENMASLSLGQLPSFALNAVLRGEVLTLAAIGVMIFTALSVQWRLKTLLVPKLKMV